MPHAYFRSACLLLLFLGGNLFAADAPEKRLAPLLVPDIARIEPIHTPTDSLLTSPYVTGVQAGASDSADSWVDRNAGKVVLGSFIVMASTLAAQYFEWLGAYAWFDTVFPYIVTTALLTILVFAFLASRKNHRAYLSKHKKGKDENPRSIHKSTSIGIIIAGALLFAGGLAMIIAYSLMVQAKTPGVIDRSDMSVLLGLFGIKVLIIGLVICIYGLTTL